MTKRERILHILESLLTPVRDPAVGHDKFSEVLQTTANEIVNLGKPAEEISHVIGPNGNHRLIVDGVSTEWKSQTELAKNGNYIAATDFYMGQLPQVARVTQIDPKLFQTTSQQNLNMAPVKFVKPD